MKLIEWIDSIASSQGASVAQGNAITQGFATPVSYIAGRTIHGGLDIRGKKGTPVRALVGGKIALSRLNGGWGENVIVETIDGYMHWYAHFTTRAVKVGDFVKAEDLLGTLGTTGFSTGPHLHYEVRNKGGKLIDPFSLYQNTMPQEYQPTEEQKNAFSDLLGIGIYTNGTPRTQDRYEKAVIYKRILRDAERRIVLIGDARYIRKPA